MVLFLYNQTTLHLWIWTFQSVNVPTHFYPGLTIFHNFKNKDKECFTIELNNSNKNPCTSFSSVFLFQIDTMSCSKDSLSFEMFQQRFHIKFLLYLRFYAHAKILSSKIKTITSAELNCCTKLSEGSDLAGWEPEKIERSLVEIRIIFVSSIFHTISNS